MATRRVTSRPCRTFAATPDYIHRAIEVERRTGLFDVVLWATCKTYRDAIFANARWTAEGVA